jgi:hypothetical protein
VKWILFVESLHIYTLYKNFSLKLLLERNGLFFIHNFSSNEKTRPQLNLKITWRWWENVIHMSLMAVRLLPYQIINLMLIFVFISFATAIFSFSQKWIYKLWSLDFIINTRYLLIPFFFLQEGMPTLLFLECQIILIHRHYSHSMLVNTACGSLTFPVHSNVTAQHKVLSVLLYRTQTQFYWKGFVKQSMITETWTLLDFAHDFILKRAGSLI